MIPGFTRDDLFAVFRSFSELGDLSLPDRGAGAGPRSLNARMNAYRHRWMLEMLARDNRMVDVQVMAALHQGSAFFASTSLIAVGGALSLVRAGGDLSDVLAAPALRRDADAGDVGNQGDRPCRHLRLCLLQVRLGLPAVQLRRDPAGRDPACRRKWTPAGQAAGRRTGDMTVVAGRHFNRGSGRSSSRSPISAGFSGHMGVHRHDDCGADRHRPAAVCSDALSAILEGSTRRSAPPSVICRFAGVQTSTDRRHDH
jgi:hypothetical protein